MPSRKDSPNRNETFGRLLSGAVNSIATYEGRTAPVVEEELGQLLTLSGKTIQRYKSGHLPPEDRTVEILATAAVQRGYLGREWLQRFLHAARYPFAEKLLDQLCPIGPARPRPPRVYHNLPAPTYSQFVMREQAFAEVLDGLQQRSAVVLIVGLGGNGKTSLAREVAARCLQPGSDAPQFDAVVWVSDKDRPGTINLSIVLDEIARTLDYPGFTQFAHDEKLYEVEQLLKRQRVLLVIDNFETISDGALLAWMLRLPEPSKAIVTSREYGREYRRGGWPVELRGMSEAEAQEFIDQRLRVLRIEKLVDDQAQLDPLLATTGGNPKALEIALGLVKHERRPLQQVVDDLYAARGELFDDLFTRAWALLDEAARRVLLVMTFFPTNASGEALAATADVQGFAFDRAVERLSDLALVDEQRIDLASAPRYTLHPLVQAFAGAQLAKQSEFEVVARERWVGWYVDLVSKVGFCWKKPLLLQTLDAEYTTIPAVINWVSQRQRYQDILNLVKGCGYYYFIRGTPEADFSVDYMGAVAAQKLSDMPEAVRRLAYHVRVLSLKGRLCEADSHFQELERKANVQHLPLEVHHTFIHACGTYWIAHQELQAAQNCWEESMRAIEQLSVDMQDMTRRWLATCLYQQGNSIQAQQLLRQALHEAIDNDIPLSIMFCRFKLAAIDLDNGRLEAAQEALAEAKEKAAQYKDRAGLGEILYYYARLHTLRGDLPAARVALAEAIDLFERLGMRRELAEARAELARLDEPTAATS